MSFVAQDLLQRIDLVAASSQAVGWNQQFDLIDSAVATMKNQLQTLQSLYTNLYIRFQSSNNTLNGVTGKMDYGSFYSTGTYLNSSVTGNNPFYITNTLEAVGISIASGSRICFTKSGVYNIEFSAQFYKTDAGDDTVDIWLSKNGTNVDWTNSRITLHSNQGTSLPSWNFVNTAISGDYFELYWHSPDDQMQLVSFTGLTDPIRPNIPAIILTVDQIR